MSEFSPVLLTAKDPSIVEAVEATALALGVVLRVVRESDELAKRWPDAALRLVAPDMAARVLLLPPAGATVLVGHDLAALTAASAELGLPVVPLPDQSGRLADLLSSTLRASSERARVVSVVGASGGLGASTLAVGLGLAAARSGLRAAVVELAAHGGGLDLLVGHEMAEGVRWADLARACGELGGLEDALVECDGLRVLALSRDHPQAPEGPAVRAVLSALRRSLDVVVVDAGRATVPDAQHQLLLVGADVRGVAAARMVATAGGAPSGLVVRLGPGRGLNPDVVASSLGVPLVGTVHSDVAVARLAELGDHPLAGPARRFAKDVASLWQGLADD